MKKVLKKGSNSQNHFSILRFPSPNKTSHPPYWGGGGGEFPLPLKAIRKTLDIVLGVEKNFMQGVPASVLFILVTKNNSF